MSPRKNLLLFMGIYTVLLLLPVFALLTGLTDFEQMGVVVPTTFDFVIGIIIGLLSIPLTYYPMQTILLRNLMIPWIKKAKQSFVVGVPFMLLGAVVE